MLGLCGFGVALAAVIGWHGQASRESASTLTHEGYVWQRTWTGAVKSAVRRASPELAGLCIQAGEVSAKTGRIEVARAAVDWQVLSMLQRPLGVAWRVGSEVIEHNNEKTLALLDQQWTTTFETAAAAGVSVTEAQWDCDCPERLLAEYASWVRGMKQRHPAQRWTFTALPAWLSSPAFADLAAAADGFVLQVHWLRPAPNGGPVLMKVEDALRAVRRASQWGRSFKVALPTYGSAVLCNAQGQWLDVASEDSVRTEVGTHLVEASSSPDDALRLLQEWRKHRPAGLAGIVWYRVPVDGDKRNWSWPQLQAVIHGMRPQPRFEAALVSRAEGYDDVVIRNTGNGDGWMPLTISLQEQNLLAFDGAFGYKGKEVEHGLIFSATSKKPLAAGGRASIGWVRRGNLKGAVSFDLGL